MSPELAQIVPTALVTAIFTAGAAWGGARAALNGTKKKVEDISMKVTEVDTRLRNVEVDVSFMRGERASKG